MKKIHSVNLQEKNLILFDLDKLINKLSKFVNFDSSILFGSFLNSNEFNDIDILLIKNKNLSFGDFISLYSKIIEINNSDEFNLFHLVYYDSPNSPKDKIQISLELDTPIFKSFFPKFYDDLFFEKKSFKVIYGILDENIYLDKNITQEPKKLGKFRNLIKFLHTYPTLNEVKKFISLI
jgi:hypothetical protein